MNCLDSIATLYATDVRFGDKLVEPLRFCHRAWTIFFSPPFIAVPWQMIAVRIAFLIPLIIMTIGSAFLCVIGLTVKMCSSFPQPWEKIKYYSLLDDATTHLNMAPEKRKRPITEESSLLFSTFNEDCINHILTFLNFREKRRLLQTTQHFKRIVEESPTWDSYCMGLENPNMTPLKIRMKNFDRNCENLRWVFTAAFKNFYLCIAKHSCFSLLKDAPQTKIQLELQDDIINVGFSKEHLTTILNSLMDEQFSNIFCFRVILWAADGSMGEGIAFHEKDNISNRHFFLCLSDGHEGGVQIRYWKGQNFEDAHFKEKFLLRQFNVYAQLEEAKKLLTFSWPDEERVELY